MTHLGRLLLPGTDLKRVVLGGSLEAKVGAGHGLEAYATLLLRLADPDRARFQALGEHY